MNEDIVKKLIKQATEDILGVKVVNQHLFAELVSKETEPEYFSSGYQAGHSEGFKEGIRESAQWIENTDANPDIGKDDATALLKHFGVE